MNKKELTKDYRKKGWRVPKPESWTFLEDREIKGKTHKIYQVTVKDPENCFGVAEVAVLDDGKKNDEGKEIEMVKPLNWEDAVVPFEEDLRDFLDEYEKDNKDVFATAIKNLNIPDELGEVIVYTKVDKDVQAELSIVVRRKSGFKMKKIISV